MQVDLSRDELVPYALAVAGHRDLRPQDVPALEAQVSQIVNGLQERMPSTPLLLLSALAAGADQLAARIALQCGAELIAVIPMAEEVYFGQMDAAERRSALELLARAACTIHLPHHRISIEELRSSNFRQEECYDALARYLAGHCQALIALWDGNENGKPGGTSEVVNYMRRQPNRSGRGERQDGAIYHILAARLSASKGDALKQAKFGAVWEMNERLQKYTRLEKQLERFNSQVRKKFSAGSEDGASLLPDTDLQPHEQFLKRVQACYSAADAASRFYAGEAKKALIVVLACASLAVGGFSYVTNFHSQQTWMWLVFPIFVLFAWLEYRSCKAREVEDQYLDYRMLAEALRVQFFWELSGVKDPVADFYLPDRLDHPDWIHFALRCFSLLQRAEVDRRQPSSECLAQTRRHWVHHQGKWFKARAEKQERNAKFKDRIGGWALAFALALVTVIALSTIPKIPGVWIGHWRTMVKSKWHNHLLFVVSIASLLVGVFGVWVQQAAFAEQALRYHRLAHTFRAREEDLQSFAAAPARQEDARALIRSLGIDSLQEAGEWLMMHRDRPLKVVWSA